MTGTVFNRIGPYAIERAIGHGGMASVFLARDTRPDPPHPIVALKVVHLGGDEDEDAREILASEQRGAELQRRFSLVSAYVPKVYESGFTAHQFYIAMEFIAGEDLAQAIHRGRLPWARAAGITIQLCEFLDEADRFEMGSAADVAPADAHSRRVLLHNDLKPRNVRLIEGDAIRVLDFGAAKALSLSRKVTRNDFGSTAYLSPECLESGDRDLHSDAWALGVLLYEMVSGRPPFRADDTRRLEHLIRSRRPPASISELCPPALDAIIAKLLAPYPADRYASPADIRADLARALAGESTRAQAEGWPSRDEAPTRRTRDEGNDAGAADTEATRRTAHEPDTRRTSPAIGSVAALETTPGAAEPTAAPSPARRRRFRWRTALFVLVVGIALNEGCVAMSANRLADTVPLQDDFSSLTSVWPRYQSLAGWSFLGGAGVSRLERALVDQTKVLAERVMANYRTPLPTVRENQWKAAREALARAVALAPRDASLKASLRYCDGHIYRINGEADKQRKDADAQRQFTEAVVAFREAAALRPGWPDPFLGLARTFIYGLEDVDRGADALSQAQANGHHPSERETVQLADGYRARGDALARMALSLKGMPQERDHLTRARDAYKEALTRYSSASNFGNTAASIRETQKRLDQVEARLAEFTRWWPWE